MKSKVALATVASLLAVIAVQLYLPFASSRRSANSNAMLNLAMTYESGTGFIVTHPEKAAEWYRKAAETGNTEAMNRLGRCYQNGFGVKADGAKALEWYRKAAGSGDTSAMVNIGSCYETATGVPKDEQQAMKWFLKAAEEGNMNAMTKLGLYHLYGIGVEKDGKKTLEWLKKRRPPAIRRLCASSENASPRQDAVLQT